MNFNKKGKCTVAKQSYTQSSKDELINILNGKNKKEVSLTKNQLLYVWQSCKDTVQDKCAEEKKFTGMTKDELVKKIQEYNIECRPFVQSIEVETKSGRPQTKAGQPEIVVRDYSNVTFGPSKMVFNSKVVLLLEHGNKLVKFGLGQLSHSTNDSDPSVRKVSVVGLEEQFVCGYEMLGEPEPVVLGSIVSWPVDKIVDVEKFNNYADAKSFIHEVSSSVGSTVTTITGASTPVSTDVVSTAVVSDPTILNETGSSSNEQSNPPPVTADHIKYIKDECNRIGLLVLSTREYNSLKRIASRLSEFERQACKNQQKFYRLLTSLCQDRSDEEEELFIFFNERRYTLTRSQDHQLNLNQPAKALVVLLELIAEDHGIDFQKYAYCLPAYQSGDRKKLSQSMVDAICTCAREHVSCLRGKKMDEIKSHLSSALKKLRNKYLVQSSSGGKRSFDASQISQEPEASPPPKEPRLA